MYLSHCKKLYRTGDLRCKVTSIGPEVNGFIYRSRKGNLYILIDESISPETRSKTFLHEAYHAANDLPTIGYTVGIDERLSSRERVAEDYVKTELPMPIR